MHIYTGLKVIFSEYALKDSEERLFPISKNRSKRIHKKLVKRFGGEYRRIPAMYSDGSYLYAHPTFKSELAVAFPERSVYR